jgi:hypothetical protein
MENRRAHPRYPTSLSVEVYTGSDLVLAVANNLSLGGLGVATQAPLSEKASVGLSMFLVEEGVEDERTEPINLVGEVIWCTSTDKGGFQAGIRFTKLEESHGQAIRHYLQRLTGAG